MASRSGMPVAECILKAHANRALLRVDERDPSHIWRNLPEFPTKEELAPLDSYQEQMYDPKKVDEEEKWNDYQKDLIYDDDLPVNKIDGPWESAEEYIGSHYQILREDCIAPLRHAVAEFLKDPLMEDSHLTHVYTDVHVEGVKLARQGQAFRFNFSHQRAGKQIRWEQSKRLMPGSVVALSPQENGFKSITYSSIVADRPIQGGLDQSPPTVDLFWNNTDDLPLDPAETYVMVEARSGFYEASRHMLVALQKLMTEKFPLANHIVHLQPNDDAPEFVAEHPYMDLRSLEIDENNADEVKASHIQDLNTQLHDVDVLTDFPSNIRTKMDDSQLKAVERMLTKNLVVVQGPPGTGKTFVSVSALRVMLENHIVGDPPIIVAAQTNHALDQLLNHILKFEKGICRLGGRCAREEEEIQKHTLYQLRTTTNTKDIVDATKGLGYCRKQFDALCDQFKRDVSFSCRNDMLTSDQLVEAGIITLEQQLSLQDPGWEDDGVVARDAYGNVLSDIEKWLGAGQMMRIVKAPEVDRSLPLEDLEIDEEELKDLQAAQIEDDMRPSDKEMTLHGEWVPFTRNMCGLHNHVSLHYLEKKVKSCKNLYDLPRNRRGAVYRYFEIQVQKRARKDAAKTVKAFVEANNHYTVIKGMCNIRLLNHLEVKVIGCTTTGLSKYRGFLSALQPRTLLIEEAAETLEGKILGGMFESLQQLILVGDHQQLKAGCTIRSLEDAPYHMSVSMFERLVMNDMNYVMLNKQRRMAPEIRKLLTIEANPFYQDLRDHESVMDRTVARSHVPGMNGHNVHFFHHNWPEAKNYSYSRYNQDEAEMIVGFYAYLVLNGTSQDKITVLTFYNGQRKTILGLLKQHRSLTRDKPFRVYTVDSYQGEENDVILLSLVRSNDFYNVGFLDNKNRLVVALSRARRGLYIFGNTVTLTTGETRDEAIGRDPLWLPLTEYMGYQGQYRMDGGLPITCQKHGRVTEVFVPEQWILNSGGCEEVCRGGDLPCGHPCPYRCHPFQHSVVNCQAPCPRALICGHGCSRHCGQKCFCDACGLPDEVSKPTAFYPPPENWPVHSSSDVRRQLSSSGESSPEKQQRQGRKQVRYLTATAEKTNKFANTSRAPLVSNPSQWSNWDAAKDDKNIAERRRLEDELNPKVSNIQINEVFLETNTVDGARVVHTRNKRRIEQDVAAPSADAFNRTSEHSGQNNAKQKENMRAVESKPVTVPANTAKKPLPTTPKKIAPPAPKNASPDAATKLHEGILAVAASRGGFRFIGRPGMLDVRREEVDSFLSRMLSNSDEDCLADDEKLGTNTLNGKAKARKESKSRARSSSMIPIEDNLIDFNVQGSRASIEEVAPALDEDGFPAAIDANAAIENDSAKVNNEAPMFEEDLYTASPPRRVRPAATKPARSLQRSSGIRSAAVSREREAMDLQELSVLSLADTALPIRSMFSDTPRLIDLEKAVLPPAAKTNKVRFVEMVEEIVDDDLMSFPALPTKTGVVEPSAEALTASPVKRAPVDPSAEALIDLDNFESLI